MSDHKNNTDASLSDPHTFQGKTKPKMDDVDTRSLGDQATFAGGRPPANPKSYGDDVTYGGGADPRDDEDDGMEVVDLAARYKIEKILGKGGMGEVLLATDSRLNRKVAIKRILGDSARSRTAVTRFLTEAKSIAALNHPNIVQIYDYGRAADGPFLIMEFVDGSSLLDRCRQGAVPLEEAIDVVCQLCDGLSAAHEKGVVHRDIKPANILVSRSGIPKLTDFGLAKADSADTGMTMAGAVLGTLDFMPPEQRSDATLADARSDLWSLAATLYQMVTGESPRVIDLDTVPQQVRSILSQALKTKKEDRYQSAKEFRDALLASKQSSPVREFESEQGTCLSCGTKNPTHRKFCRQCAASLEVSCLSCQTKIPMWEKVCDSCGSKQDDLVGKRRQKMGSDQAEAEAQLKSHEFEKASALAIALRDEPDPRLQHLKRWAENFLPQIDAARTEELARIETWMSEALQHQKAHDYTSALRTLEHVPRSLENAPLSSHGQTVGQLRKKLTETLAEIKRLDQIIVARVAQRDLNGLIRVVEGLLKLQPDRHDLQQLRSQLTEREAKLRETCDEALLAAKQHLQSYDYENCLKELARIDESLLTDDIRTLQQQATSSRDRLQSMRQTIMARVKDKQLHGLLSLVEECLTLQPEAPDMLKLRIQLQERDTKNAATIAEMMQKANALRYQCQFQEAASLLERIPSELRTHDSEQLMAECKLLSSTRKTALQALQTAMQSEQYSVGLSEAAAYDKQIRSLGLRDSVLEQQYQACKEAIQAQKEKEKAAQHMRRLMLVMSCLTIVLLLIGAAFWLRSSMRANAIAAAIREQRWEDALAMDSDHVEVYLGRAESALNQSIWNQAKVTADLDRAAKIVPNHPRLISLTKLAAEKAKAEADRIAAEKAKAEADRLAAEKAKADADRIAAENAKAEADRIAAEKAKMEADRMAVEAKAEADRMAVEAKAEADRMATEKAEADRIAAEKAILAESPLVNSIGLTLKKLPAGKFVMGENDEVHEVILTQPFYIGVVEVTQEQYQRVMRKNPSSFKGTRNPVESISWEDAVEFCRRLSELPEEKNAGRVYRLPTEAEWEYACRAGTTTKFTLGDDESSLENCAWYDKNSGRKTHSVGEKKPNAWGLYDMHGNVWEWCADWHGKYPQGLVTDPVGPAEGSVRVIRGGSWINGAALCGSAVRDWGTPVYRLNINGFRVALSSPSGIPK